MANFFSVASSGFLQAIGTLRSKMAEVAILEINIFSAEGCPILIKFDKLVQNDMLTAVIWSKSKQDVYLQYGGSFGEFHGMSSQSHVSHCRVMPLGEFCCHYSRATCHIAGCNNFMRHIENRFSPI